MATERTRSVASLHVAWMMFAMLPCSVLSLSEHCSVSKIMDCEETHEFVFQSGSLFVEVLKCLISFSTRNECNMVITVRDVDMAPPDANGKCTSDRLQVYDLQEQELVPGNIYCGKGTNATEENKMSSNVALLVFTSNEKKTPRYFRLVATTSRMEAPGTDVPPGTEGSEPPGTEVPPGTEGSEPPGPSVTPVGNSSPVVPGDSGNSTEPAPGGLGNTTRRPGNTTRRPGNTTRRPGGPANDTETGPAGDGEGGNGTLPIPPIRE